MFSEERSFTVSSRPKMYVVTSVPVLLYWYLRRQGGISALHVPVLLHVTVMESVSFTRYPSTHEALTTEPTWTLVVLYHMSSWPGRAGHLFSKDEMANICACLLAVVCNNLMSNNRICWWWGFSPIQRSFLFDIPETVQRSLDTLSKFNFPWRWPLKITQGQLWLCCWISHTCTICIWHPISV